MGIIKDKFVELSPKELRKLFLEGKISTHLCDEYGVFQAMVEIKVPELYEEKEKE